MKIKNRHSIRLKEYDYSKSGLYFVTICCENRKCLFGKIDDSQMVLNDAGVMANECWMDIPKHFPNTVLHEYAIMPNHVHGIIEITNTENSSIPDISHKKRAKDVSPLRGDSLASQMFCGTSKTIGSIVRGFKIGVTKWLRNNLSSQYPQNQSVWQRNYYEHIINNEQSYQNITNYIINNPSTWKQDKLCTTTP
jgi:REP element-mobilizing transposase RayT